MVWSNTSVTGFSTAFRLVDVNFHGNTVFGLTNNAYDDGYSFGALGLGGGAVSVFLAGACSVLLLSACAATVSPPSHVPECSIEFLGVAS